VPSAHAKLTEAIVDEQRGSRLLQAQLGAGITALPAKEQIFWICR
jgi:hypothetical protein